MDPTFVIISAFVVFNGKNAGAAPPAADGPVKVWNGTEWVNLPSPPA